MNDMPSIKSASVGHWKNSAWIRGALLAGALGASAALLPGKAQAADVQVRVLVDVADLIFRSGQPYYYDRGYYQPVVVEYDRWRRPVYYRYAPQPVVVYRHAPPPRYYVPPPPPHYRVSYRYDDRGYDRHRHGHDKHRGNGRGHDKRRGRGWGD